jgi:hypothetical protein
MLNEISSMIRCETPVASALFYTSATLFAGRKFCMAAGYKMGGAVAQLFGKQNVDEWNKASDASFKMAKKDMLRDVTAVAGIIAVTGLAVKPGTTLPGPDVDVLPQTTFTEKVKGGAKSLLKVAAVVVPPTVVVGGIWSMLTTAQRLRLDNPGLFNKVETLSNNPSKHHYGYPISSADIKPTI